MNSIEKLAVEHGKASNTVMRYNEMSQQMLLDGYNFTRSELEAFAKALQQSSEPVAKVLFRQDEDGLEPILFYSNDEAPSQENLKDRFVIMDVYLTPQSSVPLEKYNKLLDALRAIEFATKPEPDDGSFHENAYTLAHQAIAEAEGKEG